MPILDRRKNQFIEDQDTRVLVGIDFPFARVPDQDGYFKTTKTTIESIKNNIKLLLQTQQTERVFQPRLGMNLRRFLFEQITEDTNVPFTVINKACSGPSLILLRTTNKN